MPIQTVKLIVMKKLFIILSLVFTVSLAFAQHGRYETDIFGGFPLFTV